jgi:acyl-coenzyme A synthetase/AMP-(fatty) acid ligase
MTATGRLLQALPGFGEQAAFLGAAGATSYRALAAAVARWTQQLQDRAVAPGAAVAVCGDFGPEPCALLLAIVGSGRIAVPLAGAEPPVGALDHARVAAVFRFAGDRLLEGRTRAAVPHPLYEALRGAPGLVLFTSGSTGRAKAPLLDVDRLLDRAAQVRPARRTVAFLLFDHIGGLNTFFHAAAHGDALIPLPDRTPDSVCAAIARHQGQLLPTTPTLLRMLLLSGAHQRHDLSSLQLVTYGAEPMPASTLVEVRAALPGVTLKQTYGLSELGILPTRSRGSDSLWLQAGGPGFETKLVDGRLFVRAKSAMVGYLDHPSPFDDQGWLDTGDAVETDGDWIRILGRAQACINVGGEKVHPSEVESVLLQLPNVADAVVRARPSPVTGQVVAAVLRLRAPEDPEALRVRVRQFCRAQLAPHKVPVTVEVATGPLHGARFKKEGATP